MNIEVFDQMDIGDMGGGIDGATWLPLVVFFRFKSFTFLALEVSVVWCTVIHFFWGFLTERKGYTLYPILSCPKIKTIPPRSPPYIL